jgi:hypothetical protein
VPFFHCFGLVLAIMASITHATAMVPIDHFSPFPLCRLSKTRAVRGARCAHHVYCHAGAPDSRNSSSRACVPALWRVPPASEVMQRWWTR